MTQQLALGVKPNTARISPCGLYRYELTRELGGDVPLVSMGFNPSTADAIEDDQTITKDMGFARRWGLGRVIKLNAYGYRTKSPKILFAAARAGVDIVGPENDVAIANWIYQVRGACLHDGTYVNVGKIVVSWGANIDPDRQWQIGQMFLLAGVQPLCLGINDDGTPAHECYLSYERALVPWVCPTPESVRAARKAKSKRKKQPVATEGTP
jgi:hypothetical protein